MARKRRTPRAQRTAARKDTAVPSKPRKRVAAGTHPAELRRLALQEDTHPSCRPLRVQAIAWLCRAANALTNAQADELRAVELSPSGFNVLVTLLTAPGKALEPWEIAEHLLISRPSVTGLLQTLERKGLVRRAPHPTDGRRALISPTAKARDLLERHFPEHYAAQEQLLGDLSEDELDQLVVLLRKVRGASPSFLEAPPDE